MTEEGKTYRPLQWNDENTERFWRWQAQYPEHYFTNRFGDRIAAGLARYLSDARSVLDYGCGLGFLMPHLVALGLEVTAADFSVHAIEAANQRFGDLPGFRGAYPTAQLATEARQFDAIVSIEVIEHLTDADLADFFATLIRLISPDGTAIITTPNDERLEDASVYCPDCDHTFHRYQHLRRWSADSLREAVETHGLHVATTFTTDFSRRPLQDPVADMKRVVKRLIGRVDKQPHLVCIAKPRA